ncbi:MAG: terminase [Verrucomicrobiales bacterium]|nr:terminase [Verrucomicrobiales bacterium]
MTEAYLGNPNLFKANTKIEYTEDQVLEIAKCMENPIYFISKYIKIVNIDSGLVPFDLYKFQEKMVTTFHTNRFSIAKLPRQSGKSTTIIAYLLHQVIFNDNINVAILANKSSTARDLLGRLQLAYENLPPWLQQGVLNWNKGSLELENGSKILAAATSSSAIRGGSFNIIFLDEFAFIPNNISEQFFSSVYPTISSGKSSKVMIVSTPHGMNMFYKLWNDSIHGRNDYKPIEVHWSEVPGRDEKWKEETIRNTSEAQFTTEFECEFVGSVDTLINPSKLRMLSHNTPIISNAGLDVFEKPVKDKDYVITVDVARGTVRDYSAFTVFDVSKMPYKMVAKFRDNEIKPILFPHTIERVAKSYNNAYVCVEVNDIGHQVADALQFELEYTNLLMCMMKGRAGQILGGGFSKRGTQLGVRMTKQVKRIGCSNLKSLIEGDKMLIPDFNTIQELSTFVRRGSGWQAEEGSNDDLVMCCVIFAWITNQRYFKEMTDQDIRAKMYEEQQNAIEQDMAPFGFMDDGLQDDSFQDDAGEVWTPVTVRKGEML